MSPFREDGPNSDEKFEQNVMEWYREVLEHLRRDGFEPTPAEATFLRKIIRKLFDEHDEITKKEQKTGKHIMEKPWTYPEIFERFFQQYYGVDVSEFLTNTKEEYREQAKKDLFRYVQEKLRKDRELI
ncbi:MAG: hypothetical protein PHQ18_01355 [Patescibacteria group bacterium]|nr:hypothetical protein [Patescibacteria group bacterium]